MLGVGLDASQQEIKRAYYVKALALHPDKNANETEVATEMFQRVNAAFQALSCNPGAPGRCPDSGGPDSGGSGVDVRTLKIQGMG